MEKKTIILLVIILIIFATGVYVVVKPDAKPLVEQQNISGTIVQGMKIETIKEGTGEGAKTGDHVYVHYIGTLENGTKFDSSVDRGTPFDFTLGQNRVIQGWEKGILGMKVGEKRKLTIPPELGYGSQAVSVIPANSTLLFDVEMIKIN